MTDNNLRYEDLTFSAIGAFFEVYNVMGFGYLEQHYMKALEIELRARGHHVAREVYVSVYYKGHFLGKQRVDMLVDDKLVVEGKTGVDLPKGSKTQTYRYLRGTNFEIGLLLHFGLEANFYRVEVRHPIATAPRRSRTKSKD